MPEATQPAPEELQGPQTPTLDSIAGEDGSLNFDDLDLDGIQTALEEAHTLAIVALYEAQYVQRALFSNLGLIQTLGNLFKQRVLSVPESPSPASEPSAS